MKKQIITIVTCLVVGGAIGYYATPEKIVEKEVVKVVEKIVKDTTERENRNKIVIKVETIMPDGTRRIETKIVDRGTITIDASEKVDRDTEKKKEKTVTHNKTSTLIYGIASARIGAFEQNFGIGVQKKLFGPFWLGAYATQRKDIALTVGISF